MKKYLDRVFEGDCLEIMKELPDRCIDLVLCDLPYGITNNRWDTMIDLNRLWEQYVRIVKPGGVIILTGMGRFTGQLIESNPDWFKYKIVWLKSRATNFLNANRQPLRKHEDICVFYQGQPVYNVQKVKGTPYDKGRRKDNVSGTYGSFKESRSLNVTGERYPSDVLFFEAEQPDYVYCHTAEHEGSFHPVQKPVALGRWLVRTYTLPGAVVLDNACGSGSFLVAAVMERRRFVGIEKNDQAYHFGLEVDFIGICKKRLEAAGREGRQLRLFHD